MTSLTFEHPFNHALFVFQAHASQTAKRCIFMLKKMYTRVALKKSY